MSAKNDIWESIKSLPPIPDKAIAERWSHFQRRFEFYEKIEGEEAWLVTLKNWKKKNKLLKDAKKLINALTALNELNELLKKIKTSKFSEEKNNTIEMRDAAVRSINIQLLKLELTQLRMLEKAQNLTRDYDYKGISLSDMAKNLKKLRNAFYSNIDDREIRYSRQAKNYRLKDTLTFFHAHERKIHFSKHFRRSDQAADAIAGVSSLNNFLAQVAKASATLLSAMSIAASVLQAVPWINAFTSAIPIVILAARAWFKNQSVRKKIFSGILVGIIIAGVLISGLGTLATAGLAVGLMTLGTYVKHIHPWIGFLLEKRKKKKELLELDKIDPLLEAGKLPQLGPREQQFLILRAEQAWVNDQLDKSSLTNIMTLIKAGNFTVLAEDLTIQGLLPLGEDLKRADLKTFLSAQMVKRRNDLNVDIKFLSDKAKEKGMLAANGILSIIGAIFLCVPTPPTLILGASLLLASAVIGIAITFDLGTKVKNLFSRLFAVKSTEAASEATESKPALEPVDTLEINHELQQLAPKKQQHPSNKPLITEEPAPAPTDPKLVTEEDKKSEEKKEQPTLHQ